MVSSEAHHHGGAPLGALLVCAAAFAVAVAVMSLALFGTALVSLLAFSAATTLAAWGLVRSYPHAQLGACNVVTLSRAAMAAVLFGAVFAQHSAAWVLFLVAVLAFACDGLDGWLARRHGMESGFGARFDMEVDAGFAAVLALLVNSRGGTGPEVLILGFTRYAFVAASVFLPALRGKLPESFRRKAICVLQISALLVLLFPGLPAGAVPIVSFGAAALLLYSFARDAAFLLRQGE